MECFHRFTDFAGLNVMWRVLCRQELPAWIGEGFENQRIDETY